MKNLIKIICLTIILNTGYSVAQIVENWESEYNGTGNGNDLPSGVAFDDFGNIYTTGSSKGLNTGNSDIAVVKYNSNGVQQWVVRYNGTANNSDAPYSIFIKNNIIFVSGHTFGSPILLQYDLNGNLLTETDLSGYGYINLILNDKLNNILAIGSHLDSVVIFKIGSTGEILWHKNFLHPGAQNTTCKSVKLANNGDIILSGGINFADAWIAKFDSNGINIWSKTYNSIFNNLESFDDITIMSDDNICAVGLLADSLFFVRGLMVKFSPQGTVLWDYINQNFIFKNISSDLFNNIYTGANVYSGNERGPGVIKFNKHGNVIWSRFHHMGEYVENIYDMQVKNPFSIYISYLGSMGGLPSYSGFTKFNSNGLEKWSYKNYRGVFDTTIGTGSLIMAFTDYRTMFSAATGIGNPRINDFHTAKNTESFFSVSGNVTFKDNNQPVPGGFVKALYYDESSSGIVTVDSAAIQSNGSYILTKVPSETIDLMFYQDDNLLQFVPTYYISTIDWRESTPIYPIQNLTNINCQVYRISNNTNPYTISGQISANYDLPVVKPIKDAIVYVKSGNTFKNYSISAVNGNYTVTRLPSGNYEILTYRMGFEPVVQNVVINNNNIVNLNFNLGNSIIGIEPISNEIPKYYSLSQNYPNPFNPLTKIKFSLASGGNVKLEIFDILGRLVNTLVNEDLNAGTYLVNWNASNYPSGIYFYRIETRDFKETKKMILIK